MSISFQDEPFTSYMPEAIFNIARFLYHETSSECPPGVSRVYPFLNVDNKDIVEVP